MAKAKKCDRCGAFYENNMYEHALFSTDAISGIKKIWDDGTSGVEYDLCDKCQKDLNDFLDAFKTEETGNDKV